VACCLGLYTTAGTGLALAMKPVGHVAPGRASRGDVTNVESIHRLPDVRQSLLKAFLNAAGGRKILAPPCR
jgi:hypothetical protein